MSRKKKLIFDTVITTGTNVLGKFLAFLRGFIVARFLDPVVYGYFSGLSLIFIYNGQGHLGILHGMNRNLSIAKGAGDSRSYEETKDNSVSAIFILSLIIAGTMLIYSFVKANDYSPYVIWGIRVYAIIAVMYHFEYVYHSLLRVEHRFKEINISRIIFDSSNLISVIILIYYYGFYGVLISYLLSIVMQNIYLYVQGRIKFKFRLNKSIILNLLKTGAPISFAYFISVILICIDRMMIIKYLNAEQLGFYAIGLTFSIELIFGISQAFVYVLYPRILEKYGETKDEKSLINLFRISSSAVGCIIAVAIGLLFLSIEYLITYLLPNYTPAIKVTKILALSVYFMTINQVAVRIIVTLNKTKTLICFQITAIVINIIANYIAIKKGFGINAVAIVTAFTYFVLSIAVTNYVSNKLYNNYYVSLREQFKLYIPFIYCIFMLTIILMIPYEKFINTNLFFPDTAIVVINIILFLITMIPLMLYLSKITNLKSILQHEK